MRDNIEVKYWETREKLLNDPNIILNTEKKYMEFLHKVTVASAPLIYNDFSKATQLLPFWRNYPPIQRGRAPSGTSIPWGEVGEKTIGHYLIRAISEEDPSITFPGLPLGGDIRFATEDAYIHFDLKLTGPNDRADEVVASPHQISGDGYNWDNGIKNKPVTIQGERAVMLFQPELPPFYILNDKVLVCLTYFLKAVYSVEDLGHQPLDYLELACVPNGLLAFDGPNYVNRKGLFIPGKDEKGHKKPRVRVRLSPLAKLAAWRRSLAWSRIPRHGVNNQLPLKLD